MSYQIIDKQWNPYDQDYVYKFIIDSEDDKDLLPKCAAGSTAKIIDENGGMLTMTTDGEWVYGGMVASSGGSSGGASEGGNKEECLLCQNVHQEYLEIKDSIQSMIDKEQVGYIEADDLTVLPAGTYDFRSGYLSYEYDSYYYEHYIGIPQVGLNVVFEIDGVTYSGSLKDGGSSSYGEYNYIGNGYIDDDDIFEDTGEPYLVMFRKGSITILLGPERGNRQTVAHSVFVYIEDGVITYISTIDQKYIPRALGVGTIASGENSLAVGTEAVSEGMSSVAEGERTHAVGIASHAEGAASRSIGNCSHAEGSNSYASGYSSHVEGIDGSASGEAAHAEGLYCFAGSDYTHAEGRGTSARSKFQHVQGRFNIEDSAGKYAHIVGNGYLGTDKTGGALYGKETRSNCHTLDWDGNAWFAGGVELTSPSGKRYRFTVSDDGTLVSEEVSS